MTRLGDSGERTFCPICYTVSVGEECNSCSPCKARGYTGNLCQRGINHEGDHRHVGFYGLQTWQDWAEVAS